MILINLTFVDVGGPDWHLETLGQKTGLVESVEFTRLFKDDPPIFCAVPRLSEFERLFPYESAIEPDIAAGGKGETREEAMFGALGEVLERYTCFFPDRSRIAEDSHDGLRERGENVVDFQYLDLFEEDQYESLSDIYGSFSQFERDSVIEWRRGSNLLTGEDVYVPAQLVYLKQAVGDELYFFGTSNGCASHTSFERALINSLYEVIERDAFMETWYRERVPTRVSIDQESDLFALKHSLETPNGEYRVFEIESQLDVDTIGCAYVDDRSAMPKFIVGASGSLSYRSAVRDALLEAAQGVLSARYIIDQADTDRDVEHMLDLDSNMQHYFRPENFDDVEFLTRKRSERPYECQPGDEKESTSPREAISTCLELFDEAGMTPIAFDMTTRDVAELGLVVTKVFVPELLALPMPSYPHKNHPRVAGDDINEAPHPFP